ncbi:type II CAAX prenyl endopeptidase Rce1 family protein [Tenacibaculum ascidiaceicola]
MLDNINTIAIIISSLIVGIYHLGNTKKYKQLKKGWERFYQILGFIIDNPLYNECLFGLNKLIGFLNFVLGIIYGWIAHVKYNNIYLTIAVILVMWAASINIIYRAKVLYKAFSKQHQTKK